MTPTCYTSVRSQFYTPCLKPKYPAAVGMWLWKLWQFPAAYNQLRYGGVGGVCCSAWLTIDVYCMTQAGWQRGFLLTVLPPHEGDPLPGPLHATQLACQVLRVKCSIKPFNDDHSLMPLILCFIIIVLSLNAWRCMVEDVFRVPTVLNGRRTRIRLDFDVRR